MRWKTTLLLLIATIGVGSYVSLYEMRQPSLEQRQRRSKEIVNIAPDTVTQLALDLPQAKLTFTRDGTVWKLAPHGARADADLVNQILESLSPLDAERVLSESSESSTQRTNTGAHTALDPKLYGLEPATGSLTVTSGTTATTFLIGDTTPVKHNRYVKVTNRPEIYVVSDRFFSMANVPADTFRDPLLLSANSGLIDGLTITSPANRIVLKHQETAWHLVQPMSDQADREEVTSLLKNLAAIRIKRFVDDTPQVEQLAHWGFDHPAAEVTIQQTVAPILLTLFFGNALPNDASLVYAKRSDEPFLYAVAAADVDALVKDPSRLRSKACFEFEVANVSKVEVARGTTTRWAIERTNDGWQEQGSKTALDAEHVEGFLTQLATVQLNGIVEDAAVDSRHDGLNPPVGTVSVWITGHEEPQRLQIGSMLNGGQECYGRLDVRRLTVRLPALIVDLLTTTPDQLRVHPATSPTNPPVTAQHLSSTPPHHKSE